MLRTFDSGEHAFGIGGPDKGPWLRVCCCDEAIDSRLEVVDGAEHAAPEASPGEFGEETLNGIEPRRRSRGEVEGPAGVLLEPFTDLGMFVSGIVVDDGMDRLTFGDLSIDDVEEADEFLDGASYCGR